MGAPGVDLGLALAGAAPEQEDLRGGSLFVPVTRIVVVDFVIVERHDERRGCVSGPQVRICPVLRVTIPVVDERMDFIAMMLTHHVWIAPAVGAPLIDVAPFCKERLHVGGVAQSIFLADDRGEALR